MRPDNCASTDAKRRCQQFLVQSGRENDGMATAPLKNRENNWRARFVEFLDQFVYQHCGDQRMVDQAKQNSVGAGWQAAQRCVDGTQLPQLPIGIDHNFVRMKRNCLRDGLGVGAKYNTARGYFRVLGDGEKMFEKWLALVGKQRLGRTHPAGSTA